MIVVKRTGQPIQMAADRDIWYSDKYVFECREEDVYWCTADIGWITGHSYIVYGPLAFSAE